MTEFRTHPVRFLSVSDKGTLCYTYDGELYTQEANAHPKKVKVELVRDDEPPTDYIEILSRSNFCQRIA